MSVVNIWPSLPPPARIDSDIKHKLMYDIIVNPKVVAYRKLFVAVSGSHLYGFESPDSDYDLRGCHVCPVKEFIGLREPKEVLTWMETTDSIELDYVTFDLRKFFNLVMAGNGNVLEQITAPPALTIVNAGRWMPEIQHVVNMSVTRNVGRHYLGFAEGSWREYARSADYKRVKVLLYTFRVLLTGRMLLNTGRMIAHLPTLIDAYRFDNLGWLAALVLQKQVGTEKMTVGDVVTTAPSVIWNDEFIEQQYMRQREELEHALEHTCLPGSDDAKLKQARGICNDFIVRMRREYDI